MNSMSNISEAGQAPVWTKQSSVVAERKPPCLTELSALGLIGGALVLSAVLWTAIFAVI
ncbi:hypothetical protein [Amylibacter sp. SFDW26]|uniref:hypothetical protein n=1 Tax=Amylibacter sp. SFDW26 TaxID=2652722 RepID=UPI001869C07E|nr:hypothetical protein [Amylibacter sp. SFDW26]